METDVVVVGGGVTGVAVLRDLALRGVHAVLVERFDLGTGTSGRWHGLLHSGARYAVRDQESARECIEENTTLRRIAPHTIEDIGGLFMLLPADDEAYAAQFVEGCRASGIATEELSAAEAHRREPLLAPDLKMAFAVPDGGIDSWSLLRSMAADAEARGCRVLVRRYVRGVVNPCRKPADGDIIVPQHEVAILGTTSEQVPSPDDISVPAADVDRMIDMCAQMVPAIAGGRVLRAFAGSRPLYKEEAPAGDSAGGGGGDTREVSRTFTVRDHACRELICECELVTRAQVREAVAGGLTELEDLRRKVRLGYGPCQAAFCAWRAAGMLAEGQASEARPEGSGEPQGGAPVSQAGDGARAPDPVAGLERFLEERWRGQRSTIWGDQARQALLNHAIYRGIFDLQGDGVPDEAAAALDRPPGAEPGDGDPTRRVGEELVGDTEGRTSSRADGR